MMHRSFFVTLNNHLEWTVNGPMHLYRKLETLSSLPSLALPLSPLLHPSIPPPPHFSVPFTSSLLRFDPLARNPSPKHTYSDHHHTNIRSPQPDSHRKSQIVRRNPFVECNQQEEEYYWESKSVGCKVLAEC